ncbi:multidrug effflux MFS transporter [Flavobacterium sp. ZT3R18]|uniref:MFS transporter n=1 Tax=Flavobacterium sp. ZT3R18 TaxID=2594429 RepID=UPI00117B20E0|nr:MFS transporter [Flavobacterium sp. ZT3R18]TRX32382.1 multidrug effflux MFS transporter [Flavobacterium sp. ZT3R18]
MKNKEIKQLPEKNKFIATILAFALIPLSGLTTDIYLPSMPKMGMALHTSETNIQLTLMLFLISYGLAQMVVGSLLDAFGRYRLSLLALFLFVIASLVIATTNDIWLICAMRIVHGICVAFIAVAKRTFFVDSYEGEKQKNYLSIMTIVWSTAPIIAPFIGGYLEHTFGWRSNFYALAAYGFLMLVLEFMFSGETLKNRKEIQVNAIKKTYSEMLIKKDFISGLTLLGVSYGIVMFYGLTGPFILEHKLGFSAIVTGYISLSLGFAWMTGGFVAKCLMNKPLSSKLRVANCIQFVLVFIMMLTTPFFSNLFTITIFAFLIHVAAGFTFSVYFPYCLSRFPQYADTAGGLTGGITFVLTSFFSYGTAYFIQAKTQMGLGQGYLLLIFIGFVVLLTNSWDSKSVKSFKNWFNLQEWKTKKINEF